MKLSIVIAIAQPPLRCGVDTKRLLAFAAAFLGFSLPFLHDILQSPHPLRGSVNLYSGDLKSKSNNTLAAMTRQYAVTAHQSP